MATLALLGKRRFGGFFITQFLGAMNDNLLKSALMIVIAYRISGEAEAGLLINLAAGLFILPFFILSPIAGQIADKYEKAQIMRYVKAAEIAIMSLGAIGFFADNLAVLFGTLLLMGVHSTFFGPVKYSILPQHLAARELMDGNALVEMGTFLAILLGTIAGGLLAGRHSAAAIAAAILTVATAGYLASRFVPKALPAAPELVLNWNPATQIVALTRLIRSQPTVTSAIMGISWYWFYGATILAQLPNLSRHFLHGDEGVVTLLLALFAIAISIGSLLCARFSRGTIETGLVLIGALGMSLFTADLYLIPYPQGDAGVLCSSAELITGPNSLTVLRALADLLLCGIFSSFFIVPLYALIQQRSVGSLCSRVIAANNIYNAVFMVMSALGAMVLYNIGCNTLDLLLIIAGLNIVFCGLLCCANPEYIRRARLILCGKLGR